VATSGIVMFCIIAANIVEVKAVVHSTHKWFSHCHVSITEHGFDNPDAKCFCVEMDKEND
jgi:hypothetical protein